jgi:hypothetical protein
VTAETLLTRFDAAVYLKTDTARVEFIASAAATGDQNAILDACRIVLKSLEPVTQNSRAPGGDAHEPPDITKLATYQSYGGRVLAGEITAAAPGGCLVIQADDSKEYFSYQLLSAVSEEYIPASGDVWVTIPPDLHFIIDRQSFMKYYVKGTFSAADKNGGYAKESPPEATETPSAPQWRETAPSFWEYGSTGLCIVRQPDAIRLPDTKRFVAIFNGKTIPGGTSDNLDDLKEKGAAIYATLVNYGFKDSDLKSSESPPKHIENRDQLIGLLSTTSGYSDRHPSEAEEILKTLEAAGLRIVGLPAPAATGQDYTKLDGPSLLGAVGEDAVKWATAFCQIVRSQPFVDIDEALMVAWFANAIVHAQDVKRWKSELEAQWEAVRQSTSCLGLKIIRASATATGLSVGKPGDVIVDVATLALVRDGFVTVGYDEAGNPSTIATDKAREFLKWLDAHQG